MIINNNVFETFLFDNVESIKNRIAVQMNTLLKYLIFDPEIKKIMDILQEQKVHKFNLVTGLRGENF